MSRRPRSQRASPRSWRSIPARRRSSSRAAGPRGASWRHDRCRRRRGHLAPANGRHHPAEPARRTSAACSACCAPAAASSPSTPSAGSSAPATTSPASTSTCIVGTADDLAELVDEPSAAPDVAVDDLGAAPIVTDRATRGRRRRGSPAHDVAVRDAHQRHHRAAEAHRPHLRHARAGAARRQVLRDATRRPQPGCAPAWRSSTRRSCTSAGSSASCSASTTGGRWRCSNGSPSTAGTTRSAATARGRRAGAHRAAHGARSRPRSATS